MKYLHTVFVLYSLEVRLSFLIKIVTSKAEETKGAYETTKNWVVLLFSKGFSFFSSTELCFSFLHSLNAVEPHLSNPAYGGCKVKKKSKIWKPKNLLFCD